MNVEQQKDIVHKYSNSRCLKLMDDVFNYSQPQYDLRIYYMENCGYTLLKSHNRRLPLNTSLSALKRCGFFFWDSVNDYTEGYSVSDSNDMDELVDLEDLQDYLENPTESGPENDRAAIRSVKRSEIDRLIEKMDY